ncbi:hypothetical protein [Streptomyces sp. NPDC002133]|uniref:hypothetical protein n=1 Tax=Streptomyces sp. NPDC002133 TaxID=3154409 RepID=UPI0033229575
MRANVDQQDRTRSVSPWSRWFVGLRFSDYRGAVGEHYYVVGEAADADDAVAIALLRAAAAHECAARKNAGIDGVVVRRLRWNPLGWAYLGAPHVRSGATA